MPWSSPAGKQYVVDYVNTVEPGNRYFYLRSVNKHKELGNKNKCPQDPPAYAGIKQEEKKCSD